MEMESIEFYKWEKQKALIIKYNTVDPYNEIYFAHYIPFQPMIMKSILMIILLLMVLHLV